MAQSPSSGWSSTGIERPGKVFVIEQQNRNTFLGLRVPIWGPSFQTVLKVLIQRKYPVLPFGFPGAQGSSPGLLAFLNTKETSALHLRRELETE